MNTRYSTPKSPSGDRLAAYSAAAAGALLAFAPTSAEAQIVFTDLDPDESLSIGQEFLIDFDGDGNDDVLFNVDQPQAGFTRARVFTDDGNNGGLVGVGPITTNYNYFYANILDEGDAISGTNTVQNTNSGTGGERDDFLFASTFGGANYGYWGGTSDKFVGVRFSAGVATQTPTTHYAWVKLSVAADASGMTIDSFAFESMPDTPINAGAMPAPPPPPPPPPPPTATEPDALAEGYAFTAIAPNPVTGRSTFEVTVARTEQVTIDVVDALGRTVRTLHDGAIAGGQDKEIAFASAGLPTGIYVVRVVGESFDTTRTVSVVR